MGVRIVIEMRVVGWLFGVLLCLAGNVGLAERVGSQILISRDGASEFERGGGLDGMRTTRRDQKVGRESGVEAGQDGRNGAALDRHKVVATVDGKAITLGAALRLIARTLPPHEAERPAAPLIDAAVRGLVDRRVVYDYLVENGWGAGKSEVRLAKEQFKTSLSRVGKTLEDYLKETGQSLEEFTFELAWPLAWNRYLKKRLDDAYLEEYFNHHRRAFDGTEMRVAHLLLSTQPPETVETALAKGFEIYEKLDAGELDWETAVKQFSSAPTRDRGGEMGWIQYDRPMPPSFSATAFGLEVGQISKPIETPIGVHLIKCLEVRDGKIGWRDALDRLREEVSKGELQRIATEHRSKVEIQYADGVAVAP